VDPVACSVFGQEQTVGVQRAPQVYQLLQYLLGELRFQFDFIFPGE
jgi:hypothetical protein